MNVPIWIARIVLACVFLPIGLATVAGVMERQARAAGIELPIPGPALRAIGLAEALGALGVVLPVALHRAPVLSPLAAAGLSVIMLGATVINLQKRKRGAAMFNLVLIGLSVVVIVAGPGPA